MKVIGLGSGSQDRPEKVLVEMSGDEFAKLVGHYNLYSDNCPRPIPGVEFIINNIWDKITTLAQAEHALKTISENVDKLVKSLPPHMASPERN